MRMFMIAALLALGCSKPTPCEKAVHKVMDVQTRAIPGSEPKADEQEVIDQIAKMTIGTCEKEGLDEAQLACLMAMTKPEDLMTVGACPAIAAKHPSWLLAP